MLLWSSLMWTMFVLQFKVKLDVLQGRLPVTHELAVELAAYALQCECDDNQINNLTFHIFAEI